VLTIGARRRLHGRLQSPGLVTLVGQLQIVDAFGRSPDARLVWAVDLPRLSPQRYQLSAGSPIYGHAASFLHVRIVASLTCLTVGPISVLDSIPIRIVLAVSIWTSCN